MKRALLAHVIAAVSSAADMLVAEAVRPGGPRGRGNKADIDTEIELALRRTLTALLPVRFVGEETGVTPGSAAADSIWLVDPHDGTSEFLKGYRGSSISVALVQRGEPVLGVVCAPFSPDRGFDLIAWAEGEPLQRNGAAISARLADRGLDRNGYVYLNPRAARMAALNAELVAPARFIGMPSIAYRLARVAASDGVATMSLHGLNVWDYAAGHALIKGAGGVVLDEQGRPVTYAGDQTRVVERCFGGAPAAIAALAGRDWERIEHAPTAPSRLRQQWPRPVDNARLDRAYGCLLGQAVGSHVSCRATRAECVEDLAAGAELRGEAMEQAIALARSIVRCGRYDAADAAGTHAAWLASLDEHAPPAAALARIAPIGVLCAGAALRAGALAREDVRCSNADELGTEAAAVCAGWIAALVDRGGEMAAPDLLALAAVLVAPGGKAGGALLETLRHTMEHIDRPAGAGDRAVPLNEPAQANPLLQGLCRALVGLARGDAAQSTWFPATAPGDAAETSRAEATSAIAGAVLGASRGAGSLAEWSLAAQASRSLPGGSAPARPDDYWPDELPVLADALLSLSQGPA